MDTDAGRDYSLETLLSQVEGHYPEALRLLNLSVRTPEETALILSLVVTQAARDPWTRTGFFAAEVAPIYEALRHALREDEPAITVDEIEAEVDHYGRQHIVKPHVSPTVENVAIAGTAWLITKMYADFAPYRLTVLYSPRAAFITADSPAAIFPESVKERDEATFLPDTEFTLPITPQHAVLISMAYALPARIDADRSVEAIVNARTAKAAVRELYGSPNIMADEIARHKEGWWASMPLLRALRKDIAF